MHPPCFDTLTLQVSGGPIADAYVSVKYYLTTSVDICQ